jgi:arsenate reductase
MNKPYQLRLYLTEPFTKNELTDVIHKLDILPIELIRTKESIWIENFKKKQLSDLELMDIILKYPKLIERPIVVNGEKAIIARPVTKLNHLNL